MESWQKGLRSARQRLGLTQSHLSRISGVSLPSIQNIEAGRANPSHSLLQSLLDALGLSFQLRKANADWTALSACGVPLEPRGRGCEEGSEDRLVKHVRIALVEVQDTKISDWERKCEALQACLLALKSHYPSLYRKQFSRSSLAKSVLDRKVTGKVLKLRRISLERLSRYL